jgi:hypothetical protein
LHNNREETSLGEKGEDLTSGIISDVLDNIVGNEGERENDYADAEDESSQDATDAATINPNRSGFDRNCFIISLD